MSGPQVEIERASFGTRAMMAIQSAAPPRLRVPLRYWLTRASGAAEAEMSYLSELVTRGRAIDVGANYGVYTWPLSRLCDAVEAFEPQPWCAETLVAAKIGNVTVHEVGLSDAETSLPLSIPVKGGVRHTGYASMGGVDGEAETIDVPVKRLDDFGFEDVTFVKIDVEGHEAEVIRGARATLERYHPVLLIEIEERHLGDAPIVSVFDLVERMGYEGSFLLGGSWHPLEEFSAEEHQGRFMAGEAKAPYVYNFVFKTRLV